jgi:hypothetical protein
MAETPIVAPPAWVESRASLIEDPIKRLRFLRREVRSTRTEQRIRVQAPRRSQFARPGVWICAVLILFSIMPLPTGTAETRRIAPDRVDGTGVAGAAPRVWLVDHSDVSELYSNGLRIDLTYTIPNRPRREFDVYAPNGSGVIRQSRTPVGIVFHTTESSLAPFEEEENHQLQQLGRNLIEWVRQNGSYHYVIDRFGRVFRIVPESDAANHAGKSVWVDARGAYVNLNDSFLGVSFEGQTGAVDEISEAQVAAGKVLTEMLRSRYAISTDDCVTHAQVSVNPKNMYIGSHTDWAGKFPFSGVGLPDNYSLPLGSLYVFGFEYDGVFLRQIGAHWHGIELGELALARRAAAEGLETGQYRAMLQHRYRDIESALKEKGEGGKQYGQRQ